MVLPSASFKNGQTILGTLAGSAVAVNKQTDGHLELIFEKSKAAAASDEGNHDEVIDLPDQTFEGAYVPGAAYVVHQIADVLVPPVAADELRQLRAKNMVVSGDLVVYCGQSA